MNSTKPSFVRMGIAKLGLSLALIGLISTGCVGTQHDCSIGSHHHKPRAEPTVVVGGLVTMPGRQVIPVGGLTLRDVVSIAGGDVPEKHFDIPAPAVLVSLERRGNITAFALPLVARDIAGMIRLLPDDRITLKPLNETALAAGGSVKLGKTSNNEFTIESSPDPAVWKRLLDDKDLNGAVPVAYDVPFSNLGQEVDVKTVHVSTQDGKRLTKDGPLAAYIVSSSARSDTEALNVNHKLDVSAGLASFKVRNQGTTPKQAAVDRLNRLERRSKRSDLEAEISKAVEDSGLIESATTDLKEAMKNEIKAARVENVSKANLETFSDEEGSSPPESTVIAVHRTIGVKTETYVLLRHAPSPAYSQSKVSRDVLKSVYVVPGDSVAIEHLLRMPIVLGSLASPKVFDPAYKVHNPRFPTLNNYCEQLKTRLKPIGTQFRGSAQEAIP